MSIIAFQPALRPALPSVLGSVDYHLQRSLFQRIDSILDESNLDAEFLALAIKDQALDLKTLSPFHTQDFAKRTFVALRSNIARKLLGLGHRDYCARVADSPLLQWFLHVGQVDQVKVFAKSSSQRFDNWVNEESLRSINDKLIALTILTPDQTQRLPFDLLDPVDLSDAFFDTTCIKTQMHFPTDWVLLRDAVRTLIKGTICIRKAGLKNRMPQAPETFMADMNKLCMSMSAQRRQSGSKKHRKSILRHMKKLTKRVQEHAQTHLDALKTRRAETDLSEGQARVIAQRLENVIKQLPAAIKQAHERIIGERPVANADKILSLYDDNVEVIVRGKSGAEVDRHTAKAA